MLYFFFYFQCCTNLDLEFLLRFGLINKRQHDKFHIQHAANQLQNHGAWPLHSASRVPLSTTNEEALRFLYIQLNILYIGMILSQESTSTQP